MNEPDRPTPNEAPARIVSLDQFRGYTVAGMLLVNFLSGYAAVPAVLKHHNTYCSYADTIMPQFFFAVGFAFRLTFLKRAAAVGAWPASRATIRRCLGLALLGLAMYHLDGNVKTWEQLQALGVWGFLTTAFRREPFQTLVHIALATLWVLPVIGTRPTVRALYLAGSAALHLGLSAWFYFEHAWKLPVIDGGPLGFLSWSESVLAGSLAYDAVARLGVRAWFRLTVWGSVLMAVGYGLSCIGTGGWAPPPFTPPEGRVNLWTMSQRTGSVSYQTFAAGFSLAAYALSLVLCDGPLRLHVGVFRTFGRNALAAYVLHGIVGGAVKPYVPRDAPGWYVSSAFLVYFLVCYLFVRTMEKTGAYVRL